MQTWPEMIHYHAKRRPDRLFLRDDAGEVSYGEMACRIGRRGSWLLERGIAPGDRVSVIGANSAVLIEVLLASQHVGAIAVPLNFRLAPAELTYVLGQSGSVLLLADAGHATLAAAVAAEAGVEAVVFDEAVGREDMQEAAAHTAGPDDLCRIVYTSGTTSHPKGVMITNRNVWVKCLQQAREFGFGFGDHGLLVGPLFHVAAFDVTLTNFSYVGASLTVHPRFDAERTLASIVTERVDHAWLAPSMMRRLVEVAEKGDTVVDPGPRVIIGGGEPTPLELLTRIRAVFPNTWYANVYGLTETTTGDAVLHAAQSFSRSESVGLPVQGAIIKVLDSSGRPCAAGAIGEVAIGGEKVGPGYWNDPEATAASRVGGLFKTGDAGYFDEEGYLYVTGRFKDMILSGGENIAAAEVERVLLEYPGVLEAAVVGRPDQRWGEVPVAFVVAVEGVAVDEAELDRHCRAKLSSIKVPRRYFFLGELPRTGIGKVRKGMLRERALAEGDDAACTCARESAVQDPRESGGRK